MSVHMYVHKCDPNKLLAQHMEQWTMELSLVVSCPQYFQHPPDGTHLLLHRHVQMFFCVLRPEGPQQLLQPMKFITQSNYRMIPLL